MLHRDTLSQNKKLKQNKRSWSLEQGVLGEVGHRNVKGTWRLKNEMVTV